MPDRYRFVRVNDESFRFDKVSLGVQQGSVLGPKLFPLYLLTLGNIITKHSLHFNVYADDRQLNLSVTPDETRQLVKLQTCFMEMNEIGCFITFIKMMNDQASSYLKGLIVTYHPNRIQGYW